MNLAQSNPADQLAQLMAMLADAIHTDKTVSSDKLDMIRTHAFVNIAYHLSLISAYGLPQSKV